MKKLMQRFRKLILQDTENFAALQDYKIPVNIENLHEEDSTVRFNAEFIESEQ